MKSTSARLNGSYCSAKIIPNTTEGKTIEKVSTYFEYKKDIVIAGGTTTDKNGNCLNETTNPPECTIWKKIGEQKYEMEDNANLYGNINFNFLGLTPSTIYKFKAVVKTVDSSAEKKQK